jgi:hypothetical protein
MLQCISIAKLYLDVNTHLFQNGRELLKCRSFFSSPLQSHTYVALLVGVDNLSTNEKASSLLLLVGVDNLSTNEKASSLLLLASIVNLSTHEKASSLLLLVGVVITFSQ